MRPHLALALSLLAACAPAADRAATLSAAPPPYAPEADPESTPTSGGDDDSGNPTDDDGTEASYEPAPVVAVEPAPDSDGHHYRDPLIVEFGAYAYGGSVTLSEVDGPSLALDEVWNADYNRLVAWPVEVLRPLTTYRVTIVAGSGAQSYEFRTSSVGTVVPDPSVLADRTFALTFGAARSFEPAGLADWLRVAAPSTGVLLQLGALDLAANLEDADAAPGTVVFSAEASVGVEDGGSWSAQSCGSSWSAEAGAFVFENPYFVRPTGALVLQAGPLSLQFVEARLEGDVSPEAEALLNVGLSGWLVADSLAAAYGGAPCDGAAALLGASCEACPVSAGLPAKTQCFRVEIDHLSGGLTSAQPAVTEAADCPDGFTDVATCQQAGGSAPTALLLALPLLAGNRRRNRMSDPMRTSNSA